MAEKTNSTTHAILLRKFQGYLDKAAGLSEPNSHPSPLPPSLRVCVVGGGMAGLYSALLLQKHFPGVQVKIFEAGNQVGGYMQTHKFSEEPYQYFDCGAMRFPDNEISKPMFDLIKHLNKELPTDPINLFEFKLRSPGNRVFFNNSKQKDGRIMSADYSADYFSELGFPEEALSDGESTILLNEAMRGLEEAFEKNFDDALTKYGKMSFYNYFRRDLGWNFEKISYVETMQMYTGTFYFGLPSFFFNSRFFSMCRTLRGIEGGVSKLPKMCAVAVEKKNGRIHLNAKVTAINQSNDTVRIGYSQTDSTDTLYQDFDVVILAIPTPYIRLIPDRPCFGAEVEQGLRSFSFMPVCKFGIRFHSRFWERTDLIHPPSFGGMSRTDLLIRFVIYPSYGIGDSGKGVLVVYNWNGDSMQWQLLSKEEKIKTALDNLQQLYPEVNIAKEYAGGEPGDEGYLDEAFEVDWWGFPYPWAGQFLNNYPYLARPQGNIYFAGGHLSSIQGWAVSALESARRAVRQLARKYGIEDIDYIQ